MFLQFGHMEGLYIQLVIFMLPKIWNKCSQKLNCAASFLISTLMYLGAIYIFPWSFLFGISFTLKAKNKLAPRNNCFNLWSVIFQIGNLYVDHLCELSAQPQERRAGQGTATNHCLAAVPCPSLLSCGWTERSLMQYSTAKLRFKIRHLY